MAEPDWSIFDEAFKDGVPESLRVASPDWSLFDPEWSALESSHPSLRETALQHLATLKATPAEVPWYAQKEPNAAGNAAAITQQSDFGNKYFQAWTR